MLLGLIGTILGTLISLAATLVEALSQLPVPVLGVLLLLILYLAYGSSGASADKKLDQGLVSQGSGDLSDPTVSFCRSLGAPDHPHEEGSFIPASEFIVGNTPNSAPFSNEFTDGEFLALHRATYDKELNKSGNYPYGDYFAGKKRLWEARVQFRFKKRPPRTTDLFFGIELESYVPMNRATKRTMETLVVMLKRVVGNQIYHSPGDNPEVVSGEIENPVFVMPLWAFDQFIVTPEGQEPPKLSDPALPSMGSSRYKRVRQFKEELDKLELRVGPVYTFCFWGISQWLDKLNWVIKMPLMSPLDFNLFCGGPPVHVVIYSLKGRTGREHDKRHLPHLKQYYFDLAFWSSKCRPSLERIQELLRTGKDDSPKSPGGHGRNIENGNLVRNLSKRGPGGGWLQCCSGR